jgi:hypothetical protein
MQQLSSLYSIQGKIYRRKMSSTISPSNCKSQQNRFRSSTVPITCAQSALLPPKTNRKPLRPTTIPIIHSLTSCHPIPSHQIDKTFPSPHKTTSIKSNSRKPPQKLLPSSCAWSVWLAKKITKQSYLPNPAPKNPKPAPISTAQNTHIYIKNPPKKPGFHE